jgi:tripartite-type tricarboxylate transporter receptor subunit TctC
MRFIALKTVALALAFVAATTSARSNDDFPARPITIIVSQAAGGGNDILARMFAERLTAKLGKPVLLENKVGAGGMIGATAGAKAAPDGYTLLMLTNADIMNQHMQRNPPFDVQRDFAPVSLLATAPLVLLTQANGSIRTLADLVKEAKAKPEGLSYGTPGIGTPHHISGEMLQKATGIKLTQITYRGTAPSVNDLLAGQIPLIIATTISVMPLLESGKVHAIITADQKRSSVLPNVPTLEESGHPGFDVESVAGLVAPAGTPAAIVTKISEAVQAAAREPDLRKRLVDLGYDVVASTPDGFAQKIGADNRKYGKLIPELGLVSKQ